MNICLLNDSFPPQTDGVATAVLNYAENLTKRGHSVTVAAPYYPGAEDSYSFPVYRLPSLPFPGSGGYRIGFPYKQSLLSALEETRPDIIHAHCPAASTLCAAALRRRTGAPVILTYHTKFDIDIRRIFSWEMPRSLALSALLKNISLCDEVWAVSAGAAENLSSIGFEGRAVIMRNGVDFPRGPVPETLTRPARELWGLREYPVLLYVGRMVSYKNIFLIAEALKLLSDRGVPFRMVFAGDGPDRQALEERVRDLGISHMCVFTGIVPGREALRALYSCAHLFLFPSTFDTNGLVVREAAACGVPSLLTSGSSAAEGLTPGRNCITAEENAESIADAAAAALADPEKLRVMGRRAMEELCFPWSEAVAMAEARYELVRDAARYIEF